MATRFNKRIFDFPLFMERTEDIMNHLDDVRAAARSGRVSKGFAERIMLAVTKVNGCRYCDYGHTRAALAAGVSRAEIDAIAAQEFDALPPDEVVALVFAQHVAETDGRPDAAAWQRLVDTYGPETARDIMAYIRMIMFGNLLGNTFDALLSRLKFSPAEGSGLWDELGVLLGVFVVIPHRLAVRTFRRWRHSGHSAS